MLRIKRDTVVYAMSPDNAPAARAKDGDTILFETMDCFSGQIQKETDQLGTLDWSRINPATGPVYIEGARPGDTLKVEILRIDLAPQAATVESPDSGVTGLAATEEHTKILPVGEGKVVFNEVITLQERAMIGVIGTAPATGAVSTGTPDKTVKQQPVRNKDKKVGPNDPCPCGSGKKYKQCCRSKDISEGM